ncbi:hypothetical protein [Streptacidiphilus monticola]|uniref:Uncharacterized protein n=1 Tax=Streptacidiphilus monticola TaxID=2161674 RepID=A0ABW1GCA7_9ACTN
MTGHGEQAVAALERAYTAYEATGELGRAMRCAFWLQNSLGFSGLVARAAGWSLRAARLIGDRTTCAERGYLLVADIRRPFEAGDFQGAADAARRALDLHVAERIAARDDLGTRTGGATRPVPVEA